MSTPERMFEQAAELIRRYSADARERARRRRRRRRRAFLRALKTMAWMALAAFVIIVVMLATGSLLGPRGSEGVIAAPLAILAAWSAILYWSLATRTVPRAIARADVRRLPACTEEWLEQQRAALPSAARPQLDSILLRLEALAPQVETLAPDSPAAFEVRRLIGEELPELVRGYIKVPRALKSRPVHGQSPEGHLLEGLATIDVEIERMHARLAADDLRALATQQRYLELKYKGDKLE
jgi:hypothetical protein